MNIDVKTSGFEPGGEFEKYSRHKLAEVGRRVPRAFRETAECSLKCTQKRLEDGDAKTCRLIVAFDGQEFRAKETTQHMFSAIDIVVANVVQQIRAHKRRLRERAEAEDRQ